MSTLCSPKACLPLHTSNNLWYTTIERFRDLAPSKCHPPSRDTYILIRVSLSSKLDRILRCWICKFQLCISLEFLKYCDKSFGVRKVIGIGKTTGEDLGEFLIVDEEVWLRG
jgi:hypothetical protein